MWWWHPLQHWLAVHTGTNNETSGYYAAFSGWVSDLGELTLLGGVIAIYRKHSCHTRRCWRFGHFDFTDEQTSVTYRLCGRCHPMHPGRKLTRKHIARIHARNHAAGAGERR